MGLVKSEPVSAKEILQIKFGASDLIICGEVREKKIKDMF